MQPFESSESQVDMSPEHIILICSGIFVAILTFLTVRKAILWKRREQRAAKLHVEQACDDHLGIRCQPLFRRRRIFLVNLIGITIVFVGVGAFCTYVISSVQYGSMELNVASSEMAVGHAAVEVNLAAEDLDRAMWYGDIQGTRRAHAKLESAEWNLSSAANRRETARTKFKEGDYLAPWGVYTIALVSWFLLVIPIARGIYRRSTVDFAWQTFLPEWRDIRVITVKGRWKRWLLYKKYHIYGRDSSNNRIIAEVRQVTPLRALVVAQEEVPMRGELIQESGAFFPANIPKI